MAEQQKTVSTVRVAICAVVLVFVGALGFHKLPGMLDDSAEGSRWVNCFYCSVMTLTTVGFGDICPTNKMDHVGQSFVVALSLLGLGMFCGPIMDLSAQWKNTFPGGLAALASFTLAMGIVLFTTTEGISKLQAAYLSVVTSTTIGYGDLTPQTNEGKLAAALYAMLAINVAGAFMEPAKNFLLEFCRVPGGSEKKVPANVSDEKEKKVAASNTKDKAKVS